MVTQNDAWAMSRSVAAKQKYLTLAQFIDGRVGDFQVATNGGFWVAAGGYGTLDDCKIILRTETK